MMLSKAVEEIGKYAGIIIQTSPVYETAAWGNTRQNAFLNQVVEIKSRLSPADLMQKLLQIEKSMGRMRDLKWGPRRIDIDILFYGQTIINNTGLLIPHPHIQDRRFVLQPLLDIAPGFVHPKLNLTIEELLHRCPDSLPVTRYNEEA